MAHVDVSSFASKTNLASLKTEVDKLDIPKLSTAPADLARLTNKVLNDLVEGSDFNAVEKKVTDNETEQDNLETKVASNHLTTESSINGLKTKVDSIDLTKYVKKSDYETKVGNLKIKIPDVSWLLQATTFNSKVSELENKIKTAENKPDISNSVNKTQFKNVENKIPDSNAFVKKTDYATEISGIKNDYVTNASLSQKNSTDILSFESRLKQKEDLTNDLEREASFNRGFWYYTQESYFLFDPKSKSFSRSGDQLVLGYQQEYTMTVKIWTCFLWTILVTIHQFY